MAAVTSFAPLRDRIYEALTTSTGMPRAIGASDLFGRGFPAGAPTQVRSMRAREWTRTVFVALPRMVAVGEQELSGEHLYEVTISLSRDYHLGWFVSSKETRGSQLNEVEDALIKVADDFPRIRQALCYPGAHNTVTATAADTGLAGGALRGVAAESSTRIETVSSDARLVNVQDRFTAYVSWSPGT